MASLVRFLASSLSISAGSGVYSYGAAAGGKRRAFHALAIWAILMVAMVRTIGAAGVVEVDPQSIQTTVDKTKLTYRFRLDDSVGISSVKARLAGKEVPVSFTRFSDQSDATTAFLFLIDRSEAVKLDTLQFYGKEVADFAFRAQKQQPFAIYSYSSQIELLSDFGGDRAKVQTALDALKPAKTPPELYHAVFDAIQVLKNYKADRKALVILSGGASKDQAYNAEGDIAEAKKAGVTIYGCGLAENTEATPLLGTLTRLAEQTKGRFVKANAVSAGAKSTKGSGTRVISAEEPFGVRLGEWTSQGGTLVVDLLGGQKGQELDFEIVTAGNKVVHQSYTLLDSYKDPEVEKKKIEEERKKKEDEARKKEDEARKKKEDEARKNKEIEAKKAAEAGDKGDLAKADWWKSPAFLFILIALVVIALSCIGVAIYRLTRVRPPPPPPIDPIQPIQPVIPIHPIEPLVPSNEFPRARLIVIEGDPAQEYVMKSDSVRIGRAASNELVLCNDSVHHHHAQIHRNSNGAFVLTHLGGKNDTKVKGVAVTQTVLQNDDIISIGPEVRLRFRIVV